MLALASSVKAQNFLYTYEIQTTATSYCIDIYASKTSAAVPVTYIGNQNFTLDIASPGNFNFLGTSITAGPLASAPSYILGLPTITPTSVTFSINQGLSPGEQITVTPKRVLRLCVPIVNCNFDPYSQVSWGAGYNIREFDGPDLTPQTAFVNGTTLSACSPGVLPVSTNQAQYCPGQTVEVTVGGAAMDQYQLWRYNGGSPVLITSGASNVMNYPNLAAGDSLYVVYRQCQCYDTVGVPITLWSAPTFSAGPNAGHCSAVSFGLAGSGPGAPFTYAWSTLYPGVTFSPSASTLTPIVSVPPVVSDQVVRFFLTVTDPGSGCKAVDSADITIYARPIIQATGDTLICTGNSTNLGVTVLSASAPSMVTPYLWSPNNGSLSSITSAAPVATPTDTTDYIITFTDNRGCQGRDTITVYPVDFNVTLGLDDTVCFGGSATLTPTVTTPIIGPYTYNWTPGAAFADPTLPSQTVSPTVATVYGVTVTDTELGCSRNVSKWVRINNLNVNAVDSLLICYGATSAALSSTVTGGQAPYNYTWTGPALSDPSLPNPTANPPATGSTKYYLTVTDSFRGTGCARTDSSVVYRQPQLAVSLGADRYSCSSSPAVALTATITQPGLGLGYTAVWSVPGGDPAITFTPPTGLSTSAVPTADGRAIVTLSDAAGPSCAVTDTVFIDRITLAATITPPAGPFCKKADYTLTGSQTGAATPLNLTYTWEGSISGQNITYVNALADSVFNLVVTDNTSGCSAATSYNFVVNSLVVGVPANIVTCFEGTITFDTSGVDGGVQPYSSVRWWHQDVNGLVPPGSGTQALPVGYQGVAGVNNSFWLYARDAVGCADSTLWRVRRNNQIGAVAGIANGTVAFPNQFCMGTQLRPGGASNLLVNSGSVASGGTSPYSYVWTVQSGPSTLSTQFSDAANEKPVFTALSPGAYTIRVQVIDAAGCVNTVGAPTVSFTMLPSPIVTINQGDSIALCTGSSVNLTATTNTLPTGGSNSTTWRNRANTVLTPWTFTGSGPYNISLTNPITSGDTITIQVNNGTCSGYDTIRIYEFTPPTVTGVNVFQGACTSDTIKVTAIFTPANLGTPSWSHNGTGSIVPPTATNDTLFYLPTISDVNVDYTVTYSNLCGTSAPASTNLLLTLTPSVNINQGESVSFCAGGSVLLSATSDLAPTGVNTKWQDGLGNVLNPWTSSGTGPYNISLTNPITGSDVISIEVIRFPCVARDTIQIIEIPAPSITGINIFEGTCSNDTVKVTATFAPQPGTIGWSHAGFGDVVGNTDSDDTLVYVPNPIDPLPLEFMVMYNNGCPPAANANVFHSPDPAPQASFDVSPGTTFLPGDQLAFINTSTYPAGNPVTLNWNFGLGALPSQIVVDGTDNSPYLISYLTSDTRTVSLVVVDNVTFCEDQASIQIGGGETRVLYIPNVFSPYANNPENQRLKVYGFNISPAEFRFMVYNRWGQVVYETSSFTEASNLGWDGNSRITGGPADVGVYTYTVQGRFNDGTPIEKAGTATLIR